MDEKNYIDLGFNQQILVTLGRKGWSLMPRIPALTLNYIMASSLGEEIRKISVWTFEVDTLWDIWLKMTRRQLWIHPSMWSRESWTENTNLGITSPDTIVIYGVKMFRESVWSKERAEMESYEVSIHPFVHLSIHPSVLLSTHPATWVPPMGQGEWKIYIR